MKWPFRSLLLISLSLSAGCKQRDRSPVNQLFGDSAAVSNNGSGVTYIYVNDPAPNDIHIAMIDLTNPHVAIVGTHSEDRKKTVSDFAKQYRCRIAVNTSFFEFKKYSPINLTVGAGKVWEGTMDDANSGILAVGLDNKAEMYPAEQVMQTPEPWMYTLTSGMYDLVRDGKKVDHSACTEDLCNRHPRTVVGLSQDKKTLFLVVVDGRRPGSRGMNFGELSDLLLKLGAHNAMNLDGGGSSAMWVGTKGGIVNVPSDKKERIIASHIGVCDGTPADIEARKKIRPEYIPATDAEVGLTPPPADVPSGPPPFVPNE